MSEPMRIEGLVLAPVKDVWMALTSPGAMRSWLAEHAEVDLPHTYRFWGRNVVEGETGTQELVHADDHSLRFEWLTTTVEITVTERDEATTAILLTQTGLPEWQNILTEEGPLALMHTFWALAIANLGDYAEGREVGPMVDLTSRELRAQYTIDASPERVYDALTDPAKFSTWFGARADIEPYVGGRWSMGGFESDLEPAEVVAAEPGREFAIAWPHGLAATWQLAGSTGRTRLTFVQSGFGDGDPGYDSWMGWLSGFAELRRYVELTPWRPRWLDVHLDGMPSDTITTGRREG